MIAAAVGAALVAGCDAGDAEYQPVDTAPLHVTSVRGTVSLKADGSPDEIAEISADGQTVLVPSTSIRIRFDRFLLPASISRQAWCLQTSTEEVNTYLECGGPLLQPSYDPVHREVVLRQEANKRFALGQFYKLSLFKPEQEGQCTEKDPVSCGIRAFDRAILEEPFSISFHIVDEPPLPPPLKELDDAPPPAEYCLSDGVATVLGKSCAYARCHAPGDGDNDGTLELRPAMGLDFYQINLGDPSALKATAINRIAHQTQMGEHGDHDEETAARFGRAMPIIDAFNADSGSGSPGDSYIMYKLLVGPSADNIPAKLRPSKEEIARLRDYVVVGMPMPATDSGLTPLSETQLLNLSNWIARGAPTTQVCF